MKLLESTKIAPANPATELTLPITFMDLFWSQLPPVERLFFYKIPGLDSTRFNDSVLNNLKHSLALTLDHYLPLAGNILRPSKPILQFVSGDGVSLSVFESASDFDLLSGDQVRDSAESRVLSPKISCSHDRASLISLSVTLFPGSGVCVGIAANHAALDGKSTTLFLKSWAYICNELVNGSPDLNPNSLECFKFSNSEVPCVARNPVSSSENPKNALQASNPSNTTDDTLIQTKGSSISNTGAKCEVNAGIYGAKSLPPELSPVFDRTAIEENPKARGVDALYLKQLEELRGGKPLSLEVSPESTVATTATDMVAATFVLSPADIEKLRNRVMKTEHSVSGPTRLSTFVLATAYAMVNELISVVKARETKVVIAFTADYRARMEPHVPANYVGNCAMVHYVEVEVKDLISPDGFEIVALKMSEEIKNMDRGVPRDVQNRVLETMAYVSRYRVIGIAGSNRFGVYGVDFGWGRPEKVAVQSTEKTGAISMAESRDGSGGVEIGVVLNKLQMQRFQGLFEHGLKSP